MTAAAVSFVLLATPLLWLLTTTRGRWWIKLPLIVLVPAWGFGVWKLTASMDGYPVRECLPKRSLFVAALVKEPDWIYVWAVPPASGSRFTYQAAGEPRAYRCRYTRSTHETAQRAAADTKAGRRVEIRAGNHPGRFKTYRLPPAMPPKGQP